MSLADPIDVDPGYDEGARIMRICNSCRYCEGYCAVFPAMERRDTFAEGDLNYLANLCHNCSECLYACQYAPPHEFAVNVPKLLSEIRTKSYQQYAWPGFRAGLIAPLLLTIASAAGFDFYRVASHRAMVETFGSVSLLVVVIFAIGFVRFWRDSGEPLSTFLNPAALIQAAKDSLTLRYLDGGGGGCTYPAEQQSQSRRWFHHATFYGFALCFASTTTAAFYHYVLELQAPYPYFSAPVVLGTSGGILLTIGSAGLLLLKARRNPETQSPLQSGMDFAFLLMLLLSGVTGLALLALRETSLMPQLLGLHLGIIFALFVTLPYGKFVHAIYRSAALVKYALEGQRGVHRP
jgi:citrate/tricarballylate utilization protein